MDESELKVSLTSMFIITGISCIIFSFIVKFLEGDHSPLLLKIGAAGIVLAILNLTFKKLTQNSTNKKSRNI